MPLTPTNADLLTVQDLSVHFRLPAGEMTAVAEVRYVCHLLGLADGASRRAAVRGMGVRFLYFDAAGDAPPILQ